MNIVKVVLVAMVLQALTSCTKSSCHVDLYQKPIPLFADAESFAPIGKFQSLRNDPTFRQIEEQSDDGSDAVQVERIEVRRKLLGHEGKLEYVFYFGVLAETRFHPDDPISFFELMSSRNLPSKVGVETKAGSLTRWASGRRENPDVFGASDSRLVGPFLACVNSRS